MHPRRARPNATQKHQTETNMRATSCPTARAGRHCTRTRHADTEVSGGPPNTQKHARPGPRKAQPHTRPKHVQNASPPKRQSNAPPVAQQRENDQPPYSGVNPGPSRSETVARHAEKARPPAGRPHRANAAAPESTTATNRDPACRSHLKPGTPPCTSGRARITSARARPLKPSGSCTSPATREAETV